MDAQHGGMVEHLEDNLKVHPKSKRLRLRPRNLSVKRVCVKGWNIEPITNHIALLKMEIMGFSKTLSFVIKINNLCCRIYPPDFLLNSRIMLEWQRGIWARI